MRAYSFALVLFAGAAQADIKFQNVTDSAGITAPHSGNICSCGQAMADIDSDNWLDLFVTGYEQPKRMIIKPRDWSK